MDKVYQLIFDFLYECCDMPATGLSRDGNKVRLFVDAEFECTLEIKNVKTYDNEKGVWEVKENE